MEVLDKLRNCDGSCDGDQHKYQYGQKNGAKGNPKTVIKANKYQYGLNYAKMWD
jgi:hypothetical protein